LDTLAPDEARVYLNTRRDSIVNALAQAQLAPPHPGSSQLVIEHLIHHLQSELAWLDQVISRIG